ncbi:MAG: undecaprenyl-diphosphate phosphatase [Clostridia bacterium]|nr:undecaprenyl-diphosphate phosphatase [Clostridia bacterium]
MLIFEIIKSFILGIIEGITEWLPVSSTGHIILFDEFLPLNASAAFKDMFFVVIQLGAIAAVCVAFFNKLNPFSRRKTEAEKKSTWSLWLKVLVGILPAGIAGLIIEVAFDDFFSTYMEHYSVIAAALIIYGIAFIILEMRQKNKTFRVNSVEELTYLDALKIGAFQTLSLIPGTSRSGSTFIGGLLSGVSRKASAEFSFFMAIPLMLAASGLKVLKFFLKGNFFTLEELAVLAVGTVVSFVVSLFAIKFLMSFVSRHDLKAFGIYRIALGVVVLGFFIIRAVVV